MLLKLPFYLKVTCFAILGAATILIFVYASDILITFSVSLLLTFLLLPISRKLESWRFPKWLAIAISIFIAILIFGGLIAFFGYQLMSFRDDIPKLEASLMKKIAMIEKYIAQQTHISRREQTAWINQKVSEFGSQSSATIFSMFSTTTDVLANISIMPIYIFFLTLYKDKFIKFIAHVFDADVHDKTLSIIKKVSKVSQKYIKGIMIDILILSILNSIGFLLLGIKQAILFGVLAAFLNIIPYIGVLIGSIFPIAMALLTKDSLWYAAGAAGVCMFVQFLDNNFITPKVVGSAVSVNPLMAIIVLLIGAKVWGVMGMILFIPFAGMLKVLLDNIEDLKPYGYLLGEEDDIKTISKEKVEEDLNHLHESNANDVS